MSNVVMYKKNAAYLPIYGYLMFDCFFANALAVSSACTSSAGAIAAAADAFSPPSSPSRSLVYRSF